MRPLSRTTKFLGRTTIIAAVLSPLVGWLLQKAMGSPNEKPITQASEIPKSLNYGSNVGSPNLASVQLPAIPPAATPVMRHKPAISSPGKKRDSTREAKVSEKGNATHLNPSTISDEIARYKDIILKKQDTWLEKHSGIVARYKAGKTDQAEIELAINELEVIERLAADIGDHRSEHWADQQKLQLQMIDVPYIRQGR